MELYEKIREKLTGGAEEKARREAILGAMLNTFQQGGPEGIKDSLNRRLDEMEEELKKKLTALNKML